RKALSAGYRDSASYAQFALDVVDGAGEALLDGDPGFPAEDAPGPGNVGPALLGIVVEGRLHRDNRTRASGDAADQLRQFAHGLFHRVPDVDGLRLVRHEQPVDAVHQIGDVAEAAGLFSRAV